MIARDIVLAMAIAAGCCTQALAGGDGFDGIADVEAGGPVVFGFVRDARGSSVPDAVVTLRPRNGQPIAVKSNVMGLYRSHIGKGVPSDDVQVSCEKPGYKEVKVLRRTPPGNQSMVQTECTLQRL